MRDIRGITLIALIITILFSYDEKLKCSNSKDKHFVTQSLINLLNQKGWYVLEKEGKIIIFSNRY